MKFSEKEIAEKLKDLKPLTKINPHDFSITKKAIPITLGCTVSNDQILKELNNVYHECHPTDNYFPSIFVTEKNNTIVTTRENFYNAKIKDLNYRLSSTFFSPQFGKKIDAILAGKSYKNLTKEEIIELNKSLQDLSTFEFEWKEYNRRSVTKEVTHHLFKEEFFEFEKQFKSYCFPSLEDLKGQRAHRKFMCYKVGLFAKSLIDLLHKDKLYKPLKPFAGYSEEYLGKIVVDSLYTKRIFNNLARVSIKKAHEKLLHLDKVHVYKDDVLSINKIELTHEFQLAFAVETFYAILNHGEENSLINPEVANIISRDIQTAVYYRSLLTNIMAKDPFSYSQFLDIIQAVVNMFVASGFFANVINTQNNHNGKITTTVQLILADKLKVDAFRPFKFPNIVRQKTLTKKDVDSLIKPLINGKYDLTKSNNLVTALNISRSKPHKVNELFLKLCEKFFDESNLYPWSDKTLPDWLMEGFIKLKAVHPLTTKKKELELYKLETINNSANISLNLGNAISRQLSKQYNVAIKFSNFSQSCGLTKVERHGYFVRKELESDISSEKIDFKFVKSRLFIANYLKTFPIYISDTLCIRLRKYPREHWLSRTAGEFKYLLENFKPRKLSLTGFKNLLTAYYHANLKNLDDFQSFLQRFPLSKIKGMLSLSKYFKDNPLDFTLIKKPMYFMNLHLALLQAINKDFSTAVNIEVDQKASALVILSLVLRSRKMAESSNVIGGEKSSPYDFLRSKVKEFFETIGLELMLNKDVAIEKKRKKDLDVTLQQKAYFVENQDVIDFICSSRNLHKYAIMCFCYNQTSMGRMDDFAEEWVNEFGCLASDRQRTFLNLFAVHYPNFVEFVFPNTRRKLDILKSIVEVVCEEAPKISIRTLDGEVINWAFYATNSNKRKYYDVVEHRHKSYDAKILRMRKKETLEPTSNSDTTYEPLKNALDFPDNLQLDSFGLKRKFLSYLIHSIDASILRRIINKMRKEHKSTINHLHDCMIIHPNDLDSLYIVIKEIYSSPELYNIIEFGVFDQIESVLSTEGKEKLQVLKAEFLTLTDDFVSELKNMNPHHMYSLQD